MLTQSRAPDSVIVRSDFSRQPTIVNMIFWFDLFLKGIVV